MPLVALIPKNVEPNLGCKTSMPFEVKSKETIKKLIFALWPLARPGGHWCARGGARARARGATFARGRWATGARWGGKGARGGGTGARAGEEQARGRWGTGARAVAH